ncbi:hypothetical protein [Streptomyces phaeoluteigriseus]|uniref:8-oxoguanine DNA glycosylase OGG fold protein n=1 Tax=Streptomyces phaeoluteigriseus TaxID=114686 RepID=UPI003CCBE772
MALSASGRPRVRAPSVRCTSTVHDRPTRYSTGAFPGWGPSFFTKFLYFVGKTVLPATGLQPFVLDHVPVRRLRQMATAVVRASGHDPDGSYVGAAVVLNVGSDHRGDGFAVCVARPGHVFSVKRDDRHGTRVPLGGSFIGFSGGVGILFPFLRSRISPTRNAGQRRTVTM